MEQNANCLRGSLCTIASWSPMRARRLGKDAASPVSRRPNRDTRERNMVKLDLLSPAMLQSTPDEKQAIIDHMNFQAPDLTVEFLQKVYAENVLSHQHVVWDVHTNVDRWWVITNPTNLYSQEQFPNMDLAVTFHVGLCLRIPRGQKAKLSELPVEPLAACFRHMSEASDALASAQEVTDFQAVGVRCREALLAFTSAAQAVMPWAGV